MLDYESRTARFVFYLRLAALTCVLLALVIPVAMANGVSLPAQLLRVELGLLVVGGGLTVGLIAYDKLVELV